MDNFRYLELSMVGTNKRKIQNLLNVFQKKIENCHSFARRVSGVCDYLSTSEEEALAVVRDCIATTPSPLPHTVVPHQEPLYDVTELDGRFMIHSSPPHPPHTRNRSTVSRNSTVGFFLLSDLNCQAII